MTLRARLGRLESAARCRTPLVWDLWIKASAGKVPLTDDEKAALDEAAPLIDAMMNGPSNVLELPPPGPIPEATRE